MSSNLTWTLAAYKNTACVPLFREHSLNLQANGFSVAILDRRQKHGCRVRAEAERKCIQVGLGIVRGAVIPDNEAIDLDALGQG